MRGKRKASASSFLASLAAFLLLPLAVVGAEKRVLLLRSGDFPIYGYAVQGFTEGLASHKIPFSLEEKVLPKDAGELKAFMQTLQSSPPDLVFTIGTMATRLLVEKGGNVPFVYSMIVDPASLGLTTGGAVMEVNPEGQLAFIHEYFPKMKKVGVIYSPARNRDSVRLLGNARIPGLTVIMIAADTPEEMSKGILRLSKEADCLLMVSDAILYSPQTATQVILQTIQNNLPIIAVSPSFVKAGALAAVYPDYKDNGFQAANVAARYFAGEPLDKIPYLWATRTHVAVNLIIAEHLGVTVSDKAIQVAEEVTR